MKRVLILANDSLLAQFIETTISQERDLEVFRVAPNELGMHQDYSIVIVVDEEMGEIENLQPNEIIRGEGSLLVMRVSSKSRNVHIHERYQLLNPGIMQMVDLLREFDRKHMSRKPGARAASQKKMIEDQRAWGIKLDQQRISSSFVISPVSDFYQHLKGCEWLFIPENSFAFLFFFSSLSKTGKSEKRDGSSLAGVQHKTSYLNRR